MLAVNFTKDNHFKSLNNIFLGLIKVVRFLLIIFSTPISFLLSVDCLIQFVRMIYLWDTVGSNGGVTFFIHFSALVAFKYIVANKSKSPLK